MPLVFVYGTLRAGEANDLNAAARAHGIPAPGLLGQGRVRGHLYDFGAYPGYVADPDGAAVIGDIYEVDAALLPVLDEIEEIFPGQASLFVRTEQSVVGIGGVAVECLIYPVAEPATQGRPRIEAGDWVAYRRARDGSA